MKNNWMDKWNQFPEIFLPSMLDSVSMLQRVIEGIECYSLFSNFNSDFWTKNYEHK